jgi:hypothetical protein
LAKHTPKVPTKAGAPRVRMVGHFFSQEKARKQQFVDG